MYAVKLRCAGTCATAKDGYASPAAVWLDKKRRVHIGGEHSDVQRCKRHHPVQRHRSGSYPGDATEQLTHHPSRMGVYARLHSNSRIHAAHPPPIHE